MPSSGAWAVGYYSTISPLYHTLVLRWDGTAWTTLPTPSVFPAAGLRGIAALSPSDVWVVGAQADISQALHSYAIHWDGTNWSSNTTPTTAGCVLTSVAATAPGDLWAVGACQATNYQTLDPPLHRRHLDHRPQPQPRQRR